MVKLERNSQSQSSPDVSSGTVATEEMRGQNKDMCGYLDLVFISELWKFFCMRCMDQGNKPVTTADSVCVEQLWLGDKEV